LDEPLETSSPTHIKEKYNRWKSLERSPRGKEKRAPGYAHSLTEEVIVSAFSLPAILRQR